MRDRATSKVKRAVFGTLSLGWRGSARHWHRYEVASLILAGLSTPLVLSVHSVVSFDFAVSVIPGWHATIFPPYFVAGAIYSGFAMVLTLAIPIRAYYKLEHLITMKHIDNMAKIMLATGLIVAYGYAMEAFFGWYSANPLRALHAVEPHVRPLRLVATGCSSSSTRCSSTCCGSRASATTLKYMFVLSLIVNVGDVARTLRHHRDLAAPRLRGLVVGHVFADRVGLHDVRRHHGPLPDAVLSCSCASCR